jgi:type IV pilus assembly protein PilM
MARSDAVWGIDIGQCALKAVRCRPLEDGRALADAFDYVEYPKILSQPEADPAALVHEALQQFLSRNSVRGDRVAVSVPGQSGLARFIKLPPVESKKIPNIVKYEARQQIPFALDDVVWDYQKMVGGSEEEGFALETEVGLFAMKRDQVFRSLKPFDEAGIEVDIVQLTPLALYNFVAFDQIQNLPPPEEYDPENPPESLVVISLGTDSTDLVVTNGYRVWQRSVPIGGNHFTKALTKELKLTFATAEHLKRNAAKAEDPKALFQAMRPVFNDLLTEVQRSVGYFTNLDRRAKIGRALALGNAMKLPGLQRYLSQNMGLELSRIESFRTLSGPAVVEAPAFKDNVLSFGVSYGLALQGLRAAKIKTNLLPREIVKDRMIRAKKPWAVGAAAALLLGCAVSYFGDWRVWSAVRLDGYFQKAVDNANKVAGLAAQYTTEYETATANFAKTTKIEQSLVPDQDARVRWLELLKVIDVALPRNEDPEKRPDKIEEREEILITSVVWKHVDDLALWYTDVSPKMDQPVVAVAPGATPVAAAPGAGPNADPAAGMPPPANPIGANPNAVVPLDATGAVPLDATGAVPPPADSGPTGSGWIVQLMGHHYHNQSNRPSDSADLYLKKTLIKNLASEKLAIPPGELAKGEPAELNLRKLGIGYPVIVDGKMDPEFTLVDPTAALEAGGAAVAAGVAPPANAVKRQPKYEFIVQFCWQDAPGSAVPATAAEGTDGAQPVPAAVPPAEAAQPPAALPAAAPPAAAPPAAVQPAIVPPASVPQATPPAGNVPAAPPAQGPPVETPPAPMPGAGPAAATPPPAVASPAVTPPQAVPMQNP